jgi:hypothetical protein
MIYGSQWIVSISTILSFHLTLENIHAEKNIVMGKNNRAVISDVSTADKNTCRNTSPLHYTNGVTYVISVMCG